MGDYAYGRFELTFPHRDTVIAFVADYVDGRAAIAGESSLDRFHLALAAEGETDVVIDGDGVTVDGVTWDKAWALNPDDDEIKAILVLGGEGYIEWRSDNDPDDRWRIRLRDRQATRHQAIVDVTYPTDQEGVA